MFKGSLPALVTPFADGQVDLETLKKLVEWHIAEGSDGLVPVGTTGESPTLTHEEHDLVVETVVKTAAGRIPVIAGAGSNNTVETVRLVEAAKAAGVARKLVTLTIDTEIDVTLEVVEGEVPRDLFGAYVRNGPNPKRAPLGAHHWFDGDGMLHAVHAEDGTLRYRNRFVSTEATRPGADASVLHRAFAAVDLGSAAEAA